jgi:CHASE2 domain-containing sensor protein
MDAYQPPPLPPRPEFEAKPRGSWLAILLTGMAAFAFAIILTFLTLGFVWPFVVGGAVFGIIALQYLVWGWWFERIYRSPPPEAKHTSVGE